MKMILSTISHKTKEENGTRYEATQFILGSNYTVDRYITKYEDGEVRKRFCVNRVDWRARENYIPEIYYSDGYFGDHKPRFEIQTTAYGAKSPEEIEKVIAGYQEAVEAVRILEINFC